MPMIKVYVTTFLSSTTVKVRLKSIDKRPRGQPSLCRRSLRMPAAAVFVVLTSTPRRLVMPKLMKTGPCWPSAPTVSE